MKSLLIQITKALIKDGWHDGGGSDVYRIMDKDDRPIKIWCNKDEHEVWMTNVVHIADMGG